MRRYRCRVQRVFDAIATFWEHLADVRLAPLAIGVALHLVKLGCTSRAWRNVLAAAYPEHRVRWRSIYVAYVAGVGVNAVFPARAGDVMRLYLTRRAIPASSYATLVSSTLVLAIVDVSCAAGLFAWALTQGVLPRASTCCRRCRASISTGCSSTTSCGRCWWSCSCSGWSRQRSGCGQAGGS